MTKRRGTVRPALRLQASRSRLAHWIVSHMAGHDAYVEEFFSDASVLMVKRRSRLEVLANAGGEVDNFFEVLRDRAEELIEAIRLTPYSRAEFERAWAAPAGPEPRASLERARRLYVRSWQGHSPAAVTSDRPTAWKRDRAGSRRQPVVDEWDDVDHLWEVARRLKQAHIESCGWREVFERYDAPGTLHFIDLPTAGKRAARPRAGGVNLDELVEAAHAARGMVMLLGPSDSACADRFGDWEMVAAPERADARDARLALWLSPSARHDIEPLLPFEQALTRVAAASV